MLRKSLLVGIGVLCALPAWAGNGHLLHGVGAINSSMGGAGTGLPTDPIGAVHSNPALLTQFEGHNVNISTEFFKDDLSVTTTSPAGAVRTTDSDGELGVLPAVAWVYRPDGSRVAYGWGLLAVAGFRTNWPADPQSLLLAPQPVFPPLPGFRIGGFGKLNTELAVTKVPFAIAWQVNDKLSLGASLNIYQNRLIINPLPVVVPDCSDFNNPSQPATGDLSNPFNATCFRPSTGVMVTEFSTGLQLGLYWEFNPQWSLGLSYTTEQDADPYEWNSTRANPNLQDFGFPRKIAIDLDQPPIASVGLGWRPNPNLRMAFDVRWVGYANTEGIGGSGGINTQNQLVSIGWDDILIWMVGVEFDPPGPLTWRGGININDSPIQTALTLNSGGTPSVFEQHYTVGLSVEVSPHFDIDFGAYYTPENDITGPFIGIPGATVTLTNSILSALVGFSFQF